MIIGLIFLLLAFALIVLLWGGSMLAQGWLYQQPADRMPIRAAAGGLVMASFFTLWCLLDSKNPGKYDTLLEFSPLEVTEYDSFDSVMKKRNGEEVITTFKKATGSRGATSDFVDAKGHSWRKNTSDSMAVAILIREKDKNEPTRFNAALDKDGNFTSSDVSQIRYTDDSGRYMGADSIGRVIRRKSGVLFANLFLNGFHLVLWVIVLWFGLRYSFWHALGIAIMMFTFFMIAIQPLLFSQVRPKDGKVAIDRPIRNMALSDPGEPGGVSPGIESQKPGTYAARLANPYTLARMCMMSPSCTTYSFDCKWKVPDALQVFSS